MMIRILLAFHILVLTSCSSENSDRLYTIESPNKKFEIRINSFSPQWGAAFGPHNICIESFKKSNGKLKKIDCYKLQNDGAKLRENSVIIKEYDNTSIILIFNGEEQLPDTLTFEFNF